MGADKRKSADRSTTDAQRYNSIDVAGIRRKQIINSVRKIIARDGLEAVTIANIATELGTSRGVVVYHFDNKEEILGEVLSSAMDDANSAALRLENGTNVGTSYADMVEQVVSLARSGSDWWKVYFAFLAHSHVNAVYSDALVWSDNLYRRALAKRLGNEERASIVLALMKGLAMQVSVKPDLTIRPIIGELEALLRQWSTRA